MGRNNYQSLEGRRIDLEMSSNFTKILERNRSIYQQWYQGFINNIHLLNLRPNKWLTDRIPVINDIVCYVFNDSSCSKESIYWKLGRIMGINGSKVTLRYSLQTKGNEQTVCCMRGGASILINKALIVIIIGMMNGFCMKYVGVVKIYLSRLLTMEDFRKGVKERWLVERSVEYEKRMRMLIPAQYPKVWGETRIANKVDMVGEVAGSTHRIKTGGDERYMSLYLGRISPDDLDCLVN